MTLGMKRKPREGFERKQKDLSSFSSWVKSDSESPIRAAGLQNKFNGKRLITNNNFSWQRWLRGTKTQTSSCLGCVLPHFLFVFAAWSVSFLQLRSIQRLWKLAFCLLCLVDDFGGELMKGDAEGRKRGEIKTSVVFLKRHYGRWITAEGGESAQWKTRRLFR